MTGHHVFGTGDLTPDLVRDAQFEMVDGGYDPAEVRAFLDRVASAVEVLLAEDSIQALRAEFRRNAEIAQQVLDAGQHAAEQLRSQAGEEARRIIDETRTATSGLREAVERDAQEAHQQASDTRGRLIQDLQDLYDRVGASLYRFERAVQAAPAVPPAHDGRVEEIADVERRIVGEPADASPIDYRAERRIVPAPEFEHPPEAAPEPTPAPVLDPEVVPVAVSDPAAPLPEPSYLEEPVHEAEPAAAVEDAVTPTLPPAWQQLPTEAWQTEPEVLVPVDVALPILPADVVEDEPLAPGEPLVDLREMHPAADDAAPPEDASAAAGAPPVDAGSWLDAGVDDTAAPSAGESQQSEGLAHDDMLAEALIAAPFPEGDTRAQTGPVPEAPPTDPAANGASSDAMAVRSLVLNSLADGHPREAVEAYLRDQLGLHEPGAIVDAALAEAPADS